MWILPKQLHTCHSVQVMTESESDLKEFSQTCEQSLMWRSKPSQSQTWFRRWKANSWMQHLSTRMLRPSHTKSFVEEWTSYQEASLVNPLAKLELEKELKTLDIYTHTSVEESKNVNQELFSSKTLKELSQAKQQTENPFSTMCLKTWKDWVTKQRQEYSQRVKSASHIREKESSYSDKKWATPQAFDCVDLVRSKEKLAQTRKEKNAGCMNLREQVHYPEMNHSRKEAMNYPTPSVAGCVEGGVAKNVEMTPTGFKATRKNGTSYGAKLRDAVESFPTPMARDWKDTPTMTPKDKYPTLPRVVQSWGTPTEQMSRAAMHDRGKHNIGEQVHGLYNQSQDQTNNNTNGKSLVLNPSWVEQLMGLTVGWTDCDFSEME